LRVFIKDVFLERGLHPVKNLVWEKTRRTKKVVYIGGRGFRPLYTNAARRPL
jgi:hypothetical protein